MNPQITISSFSGSGAAADEAVLAGALRLLRRSGRVALCGVSFAPQASARLHPDVEFVAEDGLAAALEDAHLLCVVGDLCGVRLERAATHVALAKLAGVPVALVAVRVDRDATGAAAALQREIVAQAESMSACEAASAQHLAGLRGRRVEVVAPLELLAAAPASRADGGIVVEGELLAEAGPTQRAALAQVLEALAGPVRVLGSPASAAALGSERCTALAADGPGEWARAVAAADCVVARAGSPALGVGLAAGTAAVALLAPGQTSDLHARLGLLALAPAFGADTGVLRAALERAGGLEMRTLRARVAPMQALAWRALGPLAEAGRARPLPATAWDAASRRILARALALQVAGSLQSGDAPRAAALLEAWRPALQPEPAWAVARAHAWALEGFDREACAELEAALAAHPGAAECGAELARARTRRGDLRGAAAAWEAVAQLVPGAAQPWCELANLELLGGRLEPALQRLAEAQRREPGHRASREAVRACLETDPTGEARFWAALCEQRGDVGPWWRLRGTACLRAGAWDEASAALERATALAAGDRDGWETLAADLERCDTEPARRIFARLRALAGRT